MSFKTINKRLENIAIDALSGKSPFRVGSSNETSLFGSGVLINLGKDELTSSEPLKREVITTTPRASVLVKKKFFSSFMHNNDLKWMDKTEKMFLRTVKALFAYKVSQLRAYESLTKLEDFYQKYNQVSLELFIDAYNEAQTLSIEEDADFDGGILPIVRSAISNTLSLQSLAYDDYKEDILKILKRDAFSSDIRLTTWIVDPTSLDNYETGPGTGVIEFTNVSNFTTTTGISTDPSGANFSIVDPYRVMSINSNDIEVAINEALTGAFGIFQSVVDREVGIENIDTATVAAAGLELIGLGEYDSTIDIDHIRERMRTFFIGKTLINPGDTVHFYIRSDKNLHKIDDFVDESFYEIDEVILEAERRLFTNKKLDLETYKNIRKFSDNSIAMRHVYAGVVGTCSHGYSDGSWKTDVNVLDNMSWLTWSRFMFEPALSDPQGILEDPLTPYVLEKDPSGRVLSSGGPQLLPENKTLINSGLLVYDSGILNGQFATENNLLQGQYSSGGSLSNKKILQHPSGLIYRWKKGIITATAPIHSIDPTNEAAVTQNVQRQYYGLTVAQDVLNNLDAANILSLLIVGQPYNVDSFIRQSYQAHNISKSSATNALNGEDPLSGVLESIRRQNNYFGRFRPYRLITLSNRTMNESLSKNIIRDEINDKLVKLRSRKIELQRRLERVSSTLGSGQSKSSIEISLEKEISAILETISDQVKLAQNQVISSGDILTENFNLFGNNRVLPLTGNYSADANVTRAMMLVGAQRRIEDVRLNRDQNLFIVSDQYDENTDIRPFILALRNSQYKVFQGTYTSVYEKCKAAARIPNFEFFANSQGHLEFRPPQWNKTPISILRQLFELKNQEGINIVPDFLEDLFETKSSSLKINIHKLNIKIVLIALLLGKYPDRTLLPGGLSSGRRSLQFFGVKSNKNKIGNLKNNTSQAISNANQTISNIFGDQLSLDISLGEDGDILNGNTTTLLGNFDPIFQEKNNVFSGVLNVAAQAKEGNEGTARGDGYANPKVVNQIRESFRTNYSLDPGEGLISASSQKFTLNDFVYAQPQNESKINIYFKELQQTVSERDELVSALNQVRQKQEELGSIEEILSGSFEQEEPEPDDPSTLDKIVKGIDQAYNVVKTTNDIFNGSSSEGSLFDHLIEDDTKNLLGPGSGKRFIINDVDIIRANFQENKPDFVRVNVYGNNPFIGEGLQQAFENIYYWAGATDFDLWRQYGFIAGEDKKLPYANNPETQCRPFAQFELQIQRAKINSGSLTVVGNEYYEPGDTVYVKTKDMLYYVSSVTHSFTYGSNFTTNLQLINGHPPGVYLPSPSDIIGQQLIKDDPTASILTYRNINGDDSYRALQPDTSIIFPPGSLISSNEINVLLDYKDNMSRFTNIMIELSSLIIGNKVVLLRAFSRNFDDERKNENNLSIIRELLLNPQMITQGEPLAQNRDGFSNLADDLADFGSGTLRSLGASTGSTKTTIPLVLPNGLPVIKLNPEQILEQKVSLDGKNSSFEIKCLNAQLQEIINNNQDSTIFPIGGPKQRTFLDFRDDLTKVGNIIEIGILDIDRALKD